MADVIEKSEAEEALRRSAHEYDEGRMVVHSFMHAGPTALGADHDLADALALVAEADEVVWVEHPLGHNLGVRNGDKVVFYEAQRSAT